MAEGLCRHALRKPSRAAALIAVAACVACTPIGPPSPDSEAPISSEQDVEALFAYYGDVEPLELGARVPEFEFTDHQGLGRRLTELSGSVIVLTFCRPPGNADIDTEIVDRMARLQRAFKTPLAAEVVLLSVLIDPSVDTVTHLSALAEQASSGPPRWIFASASARQTARLAAAFGVAIWRSPGGEWAHNFNTVLIGRNGEFIDQFPGVEAWTVGDIVAASSVAAGR